jgi:hypothetical protein
MRFSCGKGFISFFGGTIGLPSGSTDWGLT